MEEVSQASTGSTETAAPITESAPSSTEVSTPVESKVEAKAEAPAATMDLAPLESWDAIPLSAPKEEVKEPIKAEEAKAEPALDLSKSLHKVKVDGKEMEVPLSDLINNFSGKTAWDKKFNELNKEKQTFKREMDEVYSDVSKFNSLVAEGKVLDAVSFLGQFANVPPHHIRNALLRGLKGEYDRMASLSPEQQQLEFYKSEAEYLRNVKESDAKNFSQKQAQAELMAKETKLRETHSIQEQEWEDMRSILEKEKEAGTFDGNITPDLISELVLDARIYDKAENAVKKVSEDLLKNEKLVKMLAFQAKENPDFTEEDLYEIVFNAYGKPKVEAEKNLATRVEEKKMQVKSVPGPAKTQQDEEDPYLKYVFGF